MPLWMPLAVDQRRGRAVDPTGKRASGYLDWGEVG